MRHGTRREQKASQRWESELGSSIRRKLYHHELERAVEIVVARPRFGYCQAADSRDGVVFGVALTRVSRCAGVQQQISVLRYKQKDEAVDQTEQLAIVVLFV